MVQAPYFLYIGVVIASCFFHVNCKCRKGDPTAATNFTTALGVLEYGIYGTYTGIACCAEGYDEIRWEQKSLENGEWEIVPPAPPAITSMSLVQNGQVLEIKSTTDDDSTSFNCSLIKNGISVMWHVTRLIVQKCRTSPVGPQITTPVPENQTIYEYGGDVHLYCTGVFGCWMKNSNYAIWWSVKDEFGNYSLLNISSRYSVAPWNNDDATIFGKNLTITDVQEIDTKRRFICTLYSNQHIHGQTNVLVQISKEERPDIPLIIVIVSGGVAAFMLLVAAMAVCIYQLYGPRIVLFVYMRCSCCKEKIIDEDDYDHNAFIYVADEDQGTAESIRDILKDDGYNIFLTTDTKYGEGKMAIYDQESQKSAVIFFIYSENLIRDELVSFFFNNFVIEKKAITVLEIGTPFQPGEVVKVLSKETVQDIKFWKRLPRVKVPMAEDSCRKKTNFKCILQHKIPRFTKQKEMADKKASFTSSIGRASKGRNSSASCKPLIGPSPPVSPVDAAGNDVFEYQSELNGRSADGLLGASITGNHIQNPEIQSPSANERNVSGIIPNNSIISHNTRSELPNLLSYNRKKYTSPYANSGLTLRDPIRDVSDESLNENPNESIVINVDVHQPIIGATNSTPDVNMLNSSLDHGIEASSRQEMNATEHKLKELAKELATQRTNSANLDIIANLPRNNVPTVPNYPVNIPPKSQLPSRPDTRDLNIIGHLPDHIIVQKDDTITILPIGNDGDDVETERTVTMQVFPDIPAFDKNVKNPVVVRGTQIHPQDINYENANLDNPVVGLDPKIVPELHDIPKDVIILDPQIKPEDINFDNVNRGENGSQINANNEEGMSDNAQNGNDNSGLDTKDTDTANVGPAAEEFNDISASPRNMSVFSSGFSESDFNVDEFLAGFHARENGGGNTKTTSKQISIPEHAIDNNVGVNGLGSPESGYITSVSPTSEENRSIAEKLKLTGTSNGQMVGNGNDSNCLPSNTLAVAPFLHSPGDIG